MMNYKSFFFFSLKPDASKKIYVQYQGESFEIFTNAFNLFS